MMISSWEEGGRRNNDDGILTDGVKRFFFPPYAYRAVINCLLIRIFSPSLIFLFLLHSRLEALAFGTVVEMDDGGGHQPTLSYLFFSLIISLTF